MKVYLLLWLLVNGTWTPGWELEGWGIREVEEGIIECERRKAHVEEYNATLASRPAPTTQGDVKALKAKCIAVYFPNVS